MLIIRLLDGMELNCSEVKVAGSNEIILDGERRVDLLTVDSISVGEGN
jgi:hypothetical protein